MTSDAAMAVVRVWILFVAATGVLLVANPHSPVNSPLTFSMKVSFVAGEIVLGTVCVGVLAALCILAGRGSVGRKRIVGLLACSGASGFLLLSWGQAILTSYFAGSSSLEMAATDPIALVRHALHFHPAATFAMPFLIIAAGWLASWAVFARCRVTMPAARMGATISVLVVLTGAYVVSVPWAILPFTIKMPFNSPTSGQVSTMGDFLNELYLRQTGPLTTLVAELAVSHDEDLQADESIPVLQRPRISMDEFAAKVSPSGLRRFNVVMIQIEALRTDELAAGGSALAVLPHVDALAREATVFNNNYTTSTHSNYADIPPLSAHYPLRSRHTHRYPKSPTYPRVLIYDVLKRFGYRTAIISSQNENWGGMLNYLSTDGLDELLHSDNFNGDTYVPRNDIGFFAMNKRSGKVDDRDTIDRTVAWIERHGGAPFGLFLNLQSSHFPYEVGKDFKRPFGPDTIDFQPSFNVLTPEMVPVMRARFRDSLAYADAQIGRLFAALKAKGLWDETIVVVTGDNGEAFMEHGFSGHANALFDETLKTALVVRVPGRQPEISDRLVQHVDITPTVLGAIGFPKHPSFQGTDLFREPVDPDREVFLVVQSPFAEEYGVVKSGVKYVFNPYSSSERLFDLRKDPGERRNLAAANPEVAAYLRRRLDTWRKLQIGYYENTNQHLAWFPPVMLSESQQAAVQAPVADPPTPPVAAVAR